MTFCGSPFSDVPFCGEKEEASAGDPTSPKGTKKHYGKFKASKIPLLPDDDEEFAGMIATVLPLITGGRFNVAA